MYMQSKKIGNATPCMCIHTIIMVRPEGECQVTQSTGMVSQVKVFTPKQWREKNVCVHLCVCVRHQKHNKNNGEGISLRF